jgi:ribosomal protein S18 acetylase RimI-like enzyme
MGQLEPRSGATDDGAFTFECVEDRETLRAVAGLFAANVNEAYMAMGDLESGRIDGDLRWEKGLREKFVEEHGDGGDRCELVAIKSRGGEIAGLMDVGVDSLKRYAILYDIMVAPAFRRSGVGIKAYGWLERSLRSMGIRRVLLESGARNTGAHAFFERMGFREFAVEYIKEI